MDHNNHIIVANGDHGYQTHRIPAVIYTQEGTALLFWEGRRGSGSDFAQIHLLVSYSDDLGQTWSVPEVVHQEGSAEESISMGNPVPIEDRETGNIHLLFTRNNEDVFATWSDDDGRTWREPEDITKQARPSHWLRYWTGPGHGLQLRHGPHAGRLVVPSYHLEPYRTDGPDICYCHVLYSDDHGETWHPGGNTLRGEDIPDVTFESGWWPDGFVWSGSEALCAERHNGKLFMLIRNQVQYQNHKAYTVSPDGGQSWRPMRLQPDLPGLKCQSGLLNISGKRSNKTEEDTLITTGIASTDQPKGRRDLTLWMSEDGGKSWTETLLVNRGPSGYSDLCPLPDGRVLCVYETRDDNYHGSLQLALLSPRTE